MNSLPLHPIVVHLPLVLAFLVPVIVLAVLVGRAKGWLHRRSWWAAVVAGAVFALGTVVAVNTGSQEEERVEDVVGNAPIEDHEEAAETLMWGSLVLLGLLGATPFLRSARPERVVASLAAIAGIALAATAVSVGHSGGQLVYRYGAAAAYADGGQSTARGIDQPVSRERRERDEEREEHR